MVGGLTNFSRCERELRKAFSQRVVTQLENSTQSFNAMGTW